MDASTLQEKLDGAGELMVVVEEFEQPLELHLHDTEIGDDTITVDLADGTLTIGVDNITGYWIHQKSLGDYGLN